MSLSKAGPREPKCSRCRHHGLVVPLKGHVKLCPFLRCSCWKCVLVTQRSRLRREQQRPSAHPAEGTGSALAPYAPGGAPGGAPGTDASCPPIGASYLSRTAPLPVIQFPVSMPAHYPASFSPCPGFLPYMPLLPPVPSGLYSSHLFPLAFPRPGLHRPPLPLPLPGPPADSGRILHILPPPSRPNLFQVTSEQHPRAPKADTIE